MAIAISYNAYPAGLSRAQNITTLLGRVTLSGSYATGGETFSLPAVPGYDVSAPIQVFIFGQSGFLYSYNMTTKKLQVFQYNYPGAAAGPATELPAGAYPAGVTGDVIAFEANVDNT